MQISYLPFSVTMSVLRFLLLNSLACLVNGVNYAEQAAQDVSLVCDGIPDWRTNKINFEKLMSSYAETNNELLRIVEDVNCNQDNASNCLTDHRQGLIKTALRASFTFILAIIMLVLYVLFFAPCACCRCCRRSRLCFCLRESGPPLNYGRGKKITLAVSTLLLISGFVISASFALLANDEIDAGSQGMYCEAFKFVDYTINGYDDPTGESSWIGFNPAVQKFSNIGDSLDTTFANSVSNIMASTQNFERDIATLTGLMTLIKSTLGNPDNYNVGINTCVFCEYCCGTDSTLLDGLIDGISNGAAGALQNLRTEVRDGLTGQGLDDMKAIFKGAMTPLQQSDDLISNTLGEYIVAKRTDGQDYLAMIKKIILGITLAVIVPGLLLILTFARGVMCSRRSTFSDRSIRPQGPCCASCSWCVTCGYSFVVLLIAGVVLLIGYLLATSCVVMQDIATYVDYFAQRMSGDTSQLVNVVDSCFPAGADGEFTQYITVGGKTLASQLDIGSNVKQYLDDVDAQFVSNPASIVNDPIFEDFAYGLDKYGSVFLASEADLRSVYPPDPSALPTGDQDTLYEAVSRSIPECADRSPITVSGTSPSDLLMSAFVNEPTTITFTGLPTVMGTYQSAGLNPSLATCSGNPLDMDLSTLTLSEQNPWGPMIDSKSGLKDKTDFSCPSYVTALDSDGVYQFTTTDQNCNYNDYVLYVAQLHTDLIAAATAVDDEVDPSGVTSVVADLKDNLRTAISTSFLDPIEEIIEGINCKFVSVVYNEFVNAMCDATVPGMIAVGVSWAALALVGWLVIMLEFYIWRRLKDNQCKWGDQVANAARGI